MSDTRNGPRHCIIRLAVGENQVEMAANGVDMTEAGEVVAGDSGSELGGKARQYKRQKLEKPHEVSDHVDGVMNGGHPQDRDSHDITLHDLNDK